MTADKTLDELAAWIDANSGNYANVATWTIRKSGDARDRAFPLITLEATGADEHEVLRGVYDPLTVEVTIETIPHEDGASASADTIATHEEDAVALYQILADRAAVDWINGRGRVRCFDIRGSEGTMEPEDDRRKTTIELRVVCSSF